MKIRKKFLITVAILFIFVTMQFTFLNKVQALSADQYKSKIDSILGTWEGNAFNPNTYYQGHNSFYNCSNCGYGAWECLAFARYCQNQFYGDCDHCGDYTWLYSGSINSITDLRVGDVIRYCSDSYNDHSIVIIDTDSSNNTVRIMDCNSNYDDHIVRSHYRSFSEIKGFLNAGTLHEGGTSHLLRKPGNDVITVSGDRTAPTVTEILVDPLSITSDSIVVKAKATDNVGVTGIKFRVWQSGYSSNSGTTKWGSYNSSTGYYEAKFTKTETNQSADGLCCVDCWAYDEKGNESSKSGIYDFVFAKKASGLGNFTARIVSGGDPNYCIGVSGTENGDDLKLKTKDLNDKSQIWKFEEQSNGSYKITNYVSGKSFDTEGGAGAVDNGTIMQIWNYTNTAAQMHYMLQNYNDGYRFVPTNNNAMRAMDVKDGKITDNQPIWLYNTQTMDNKAQTWKFEKLAQTLEVNQYTSMPVGESRGISIYVDLERASSEQVTIALSDTSIATATYNGTIMTISGKKAGKAYITVKTTDGSNLSKTCEVDVIDPKVLYTTHVQNVGWQDYVSNGETAGTEHKSLRLEGIKIKLDRVFSSLIQYRTHVQNIGWQDWKSNDAMSGTEHQSLRLEAIQIKLTGNVANYYDVYYRVHAQNFGWLDWAKNGESAGTQGFSYRLEAIQIKLVKKGSAAPGSTTRAFVKNTPSVTYTTHVQNVGWQGVVKDGATSGTEHKSLRLEGIKISLQNNGNPGGVQYSTHVQNIGWQDWKTNGAMAGTEHKSLRLEAIKIKLTGDIANEYDIYYRVHAQNFGWMGWAKNGAAAGTQGYSYRLEAIQIKLVKKGNAAPGSTANAFKQK